MNSSWSILTKAQIKRIQVVTITICLTVISGCSTKLVDWTATSSNSITGSVVPIAQLSSSTIQSASVPIVCTSPVASLYKFSSSGTRSLPALQTVAVASNGSYSFSNIASLGVSAQSSLTAPLLVEITGCNQSLSRVLTSLTSQDVTWGTSLVAYTVNSTNASTFLAASSTQINQVYSSVASATDYSSAYAALNSSGATSFQTASGAAPSILLTAAPLLTTASVPTSLHEKTSASLLVSVAQWSSTYSYAYLWKLDSLQIGATATLAYTPGGNTQGNHTITAYWGQADGSGNLDLTKPYSSKSFSVSVTNDYPAVSPAFVASPTTVKGSAVSLQVTTGTALANCDTFSALAITEDLPTAPLTATAYSVVCSTSPTQSVSYTLQNGPGAHTLYLWARDSAGNLSAVASQTSVNYTPPVLTVTAPLANAYINQTNQSSFTVNGTCGENGQAVTASVSTVSASAVCTSNTFSMNLDLHLLADGNLTLTTNHADSAGDSATTVTRTLIKNTQTPNLTIVSPAASAPFKVTAINFTGTCTTGQTISASGSGVSSAASVTCSSSSYSIPVTLTTGDGSKLVVMTATDVAGNTLSVNRTITLDTTAPVLAFASTAVQTQFTKTNSATFSGSCESGLTITVGGTESSSTSCTSGAWTYSTGTQTSDGVRSYTFSQTDAAGNTTTKTGSWTRDTIAPLVTIASPAAGTSVQSTLTISGSCETGLSVTISGDLLSSYSTPCNSASFTQAIFFSAGDGTKTVNVNQTDSATNSTTISRNFGKDTTAPAITQTLLASQAYSKTNSVTFGGACESGLTVSVSGADNNTTTCSGGAWSYATNTQTVDGTRSFTFTQTDAAGNPGQVSANWIRDTQPPVLTISSSASVTTSGSTITFNGTCELGQNVIVTGPINQTLPCSAGSWTFTDNKSTDAVYTYNLSETDAASNTSTQTATWTRSTSGPAITLTQTSPQLTNGNSFVFSGTCNGGNAGSSGSISVKLNGTAVDTATCSSTTSINGSWSYTASKSVDGTYDYVFGVIDNFATPRSSSAEIIWNRDATAPQMSSATFSVNGGSSTTAQSYNGVSFTATDNLSNVKSFCLKTTSAQPLVSDSCWYPVNGSITNVTPSNNVTISNYPFNIGITPQTYTVYAWVMDGAGNISTNSATTGKDQQAITLAPITPPAVSTVLASNSDTMNGASSERIIPGGSDVYIRWTASGTSLGATPVSLSFTSDDSTWTSITTGLANGINNCSTLKGSGSASTNATGCYKWAGNSPSTNYFKVRVSVSNTNGSATFANSSPLNSSQMQIIAGNTETGLNGAATSAVFQANYSVPSWVDNQSIAVSSTGIIYFRDIANGIVAVNPADGKVKQIIPLGAATKGLGDGGSVANAALYMPQSITLDGQDRLLIYDYDRIRRIDFSTSPATINTIAGGGTDSSSTVTNPLSLQFTANFMGFSGGNVKFTLQALPNGDVYFFTDNPGMYSNKRLRVYHESSKTISTLNFNGSITDQNGIVYSDITNCGISIPFIEYNTSSSQITNLLVAMQSNAGSTTCISPAIAAGTQYSAVLAFDPISGTVKSSQVAAYSTGVNTGAAWAFSISSLDGHIYSIDRARNQIGTFDSSANQWKVLVGTGTSSSCVDGTTATSCSIDPGGGFVDANGHLYFVDRGAIRTISNGKVVTLYGQPPNSGDGGLATNARFGRTLSVQERTDSSIIVLDVLTARLRIFARNNNITTISGNDTLAAPNPSALANTTSINPSGLAIFTLDASNNIYFESGLGQINLLPNTYATSPSSTYWTTPQDSSNRGWFQGSTSHDVASGLSAGQVSTVGEQFMLLGNNGTNLLFNYWSPSVGLQKLVFATVNMSSSLYTIGMGPHTDTSNFCGDGTSLSSCGQITGEMGNGSILSQTTIAASYDDINSRWLIVDRDQKTIRSFVGNGTGTIQTATTFPNQIQSFLFHHFASYNSHRYFYYCSIAGRMYLRDADANSGSGAEVALPWPITSVKCTGSQFTFDATNNSLIFTFTQNGLFGVAELLNVDPASNGL